ncbi:TIGR03792 family protein [Synechococcus sp. Cruz-9H2]|uniref:TIGR03792 family protein n=1 Tax=unclassified Synechococcus TaxID=2626047 RepID=UPI0020CC4831|nr:MULTISPECIES: TIGR03792 family protein [unclassified Synechococcus]MCP9819234.1 TIGR03792 family protein [Synechococcus sp. Cruz-9H2]MCP9843738.1 TIGR03792 family protein [Synechococcus sp. Edmonson 11F2]MCP9855543.1 TIGR03792 family protein [Synechococcus sp. Cruz-9C9]MCP9862981.1 TIGR03792 family protein [Synechococcus sp. Cruz-7E5]MCP9870144.1 TIGR03792 family protein [Synechococcus sp. Cruz-7B9]
MGRVWVLALFMVTMLLGVTPTTVAAAGASAPPSTVSTSSTDTAAGDVVELQEVVEILRLKVPAADREAWLVAERQSWEPWLQKQSGFLERRVYWDSTSEEGVLLIRWASRQQWQGIAAAEVERVQERFDQLARRGTGRSDPHPFPLLFSGELIPQ